MNFAFRPLHSFKAPMVIGGTEGAVALATAEVKGLNNMIVQLDGLSLAADSDMLSSNVLGASSSVISASCEEMLLELVGMDRACTSSLPATSAGVEGTSTEEELEFTEVFPYWRHWP